MDIGEVECVIPAEIQERNGRYVVEIPASVLKAAGVGVGEVCRVGLFAGTAASQETAERSWGEEDVSASSGLRGDSDGQKGVSRSMTAGAGETPIPVTEGDVRRVEIDGVGDQGDGIARTPEGFVIFVPGTHRGENVVVEIDDVHEKFAFAEVVPPSRLDHTEH